MSASERFDSRPRFAVVAAIFVYALLMRVLPYVLHKAFGMDINYAYNAYPWNFSPIFALAIFCGAMWSTRTAIALPLVLFLASDLVIALLMGSDWGSYRDQPFTYGAFALMALCGMPLRTQRNAFSVATAGFAGGLVFFIVTNLGVWLTGGGFSRPHTPAGLAQCFVDALPFFTPTLVSLAVFLPVLFSPLVLTRPVSVRLEQQSDS